MRDLEVNKNESAGRSGSAPRPSLLRRYTDLTGLLYLLRRRCITLVSPEAWDDKNDSHFLSRYKKKRRLGSVLALCMTEADETYHHWRVFSNSPAGVCIVFDKDKLLKTLEPNRRRVRKGSKLSHRPVKYLDIRALKEKKSTNQLELEDLPFVKRIGFKPEAEFRLLYTAKTKGKEQYHRHIRIDLDCIHEVRLSPWLIKSHTRSISTTLRGIPGCKNLKINRSTLVSNKDWQHVAN